jgi:F0F1-type ATP synthase delta subunit
MKYKSRDYAKTLVEIMLKEKDSAKMVAGFLAFVKKNRDDKKLMEILKLAEKLYFKKTGNKKIMLETARPFNFKNSDLINNLVKKGDIVVEKINKELIAGVKIVVNEERQLDFSLQKKLQELV